MGLPALLRTLFRRWKLLACLPAGMLGDEPGFRAGANRVDISPLEFPVIVNAMFTERSADAVVDPLLARALVLESGSHRIALCVVDTCMMPRDLIDAAKAQAAARSGIPVDRMLVSATHTHSAPSAMGCLGSRVDPRYAALLPGRIADAIAGAAERLAPARVGWIAVDDWEHTFNRRWIRRPDRILADPFGEPTVRAHMHPGHESPDAVGPSGPVDPGLTLLAISTPAGEPLAAFANYSQHYYGSPLLSSDYYHRFAGHLARGLGAGSDFVAILSQGTSGDLMWMDYGAPATDIGYDAYAERIAARAAQAWSNLTWHASAPVGMVERILPLRYRVPGPERLAWADRVIADLGTNLPATLPQVYALEARHLWERRQTELRLQAIRIGDLAIAALPNEVFALTGLKLKAGSPFGTTMNVSLANGAEGYIPPPEQHLLGGYTTWPARTAGLEVGAEPRIVETLLQALENLGGGPRRPLPVEHGPYARAVLASRPSAYWRLDEMKPPTAMDATGHGRDALMEGGIAMYLPGAGSGTGVSPAAELTPSRFSGGRINRSVHLAGGRLRAPAPAGREYSVELWVWNGLPNDVRPVTGYLVSHGATDAGNASGIHLGIGGQLHPGLAGRLFLSDGDPGRVFLAGGRSLALRTWHHVVLVRSGRRARVYLDGAPEPEIDMDLPPNPRPSRQALFLGGRADGVAGLEGRLDEVAVYERALEAGEIATHHRASGLGPNAPGR